MKVWPGSSLQNSLPATVLSQAFFPFLRKTFEAIAACFKCSVISLNVLRASHKLFCYLPRWIASSPRESKIFNKSLINTLNEFFQIILQLQKIFGQNYPSCVQ
jgi:hypothetical protein